MALEQPSARSGPRGAYGLRIAGPFAGIERLLAHAKPHWPALEIALEIGSDEIDREYVTADRALLRLLGGTARAERSPGRVVFTLEQEIGVAALVHPYLAPVAGLFAHWHGRESLHAGAFLAGGGAWGILGEREGGKSSTLALLAGERVPIVTDDVLVIEDDVVFAGPRVIDLRREPAQALGIGTPLGVLGARERWRLLLDQVDATSPLRGWIFLAWGDDVSVSPIAAGNRLQRLAAERTVRLAPQDPTALLRLAALPAYEVRRPRSWETLEVATRMLLETID